MKIKIKFTVNFMTPWNWLKRKVALIIAFAKGTVREWTHWSEHCWWSVDTEDNDRILWIGTTKESSESRSPVRAVKTYYGTFQKEGNYDATTGSIQ